MKKELADYLNKESKKLKRAQKRELSSTAHTPRPWLMQHEFDNEPTYIVQGEDTIATIDPGPQALIRAQLIAAAPDLLEALAEMLDIFEEYAEDWEKGSAGLAIIGDAKKAIAKAKDGAQ